MGPTSPPPRDRRIDLLKGCALALVFIDHLEDALGIALLSRVTLRAIGPSDAASLFVLLSAIVVGRTDSHRLERDGWGGAMTHALQRTGQLYPGYLAAVVIALGLASYPHSPGLSSLWKAATLQSAPDPFHILWLYLLLRPLSPLMLALLRRSLVAGLLGSLALYATVQWLSLTHSHQSFLHIPGWYYHPGGWQLLGTLALALGLLWQRHPQPLTPHWRRIAIPSVVALLIAGWWLRPAATSQHNAWLDSLPPESRHLLIEVTDKRTLTPLRLLHGLAVATLGAAAIPSRWATHLPRGLHPLADCGQRSLLIYTGSLLLIPILTRITIRLGLSHDTAWVLLLELNSLVLLACLARWRSHRVPS